MVSVNGKMETGYGTPVKGKIIGNVKATHSKPFMYTI